MSTSINQTFKKLYMLMLLESTIHGALAGKNLKLFLVSSYDGGLPLLKHVINPFSYYSEFN